MKLTKGTLRLYFAKVRYAIVAQRYVTSPARRRASERVVTYLCGNMRNVPLRLGIDTYLYGCIIVTYL